MIDKTSTVGTEEAELIGLSALRFLAEDPERLGRFIALTGIGPDALRSGADTPAILTAVVNHLMQDESTLLMFCAENGVDPESVAPAHAALAERAETA